MKSNHNMTLIAVSVGILTVNAISFGTSYANSLNASESLKAVPVNAPVAVNDPAAEAEKALTAQDALQTDDTAKTETNPEAIATPTPVVNSQTPNPTQTSATQMGVAAETTLPKGILPPASLATTPEQPPLEATMDGTVPPITPETPGMDLPIEPEKTPEELEAEMREEAFKAASGGLMPLRPDEIRRIKEMADENKLAIETPILPNPKPESTFTTVSLDPGQPPVELKTAMGNVTTLSILDATGQPWPIQDISWAGNFEVLQPEQGSHMLRITPMSEFATGNVSMRLIGLTPPIIFTMKTDRRSVQVRADVQIPQNGPNAVIAPVQAAPTITTAAGDIGMTQILEGVPPTEAQKMKIAGVDGRTSAYDVNGVTYVRTPYTLLSPAWNASLRSADGTNVYALRFAPVLLLSDKGQLRKARLERVDTDNE